MSIFISHTPLRIDRQLNERLVALQLPIAGLHLYAVYLLDITGDALTTEQRVRLSNLLQADYLEEGEVAVPSLLESKKRDWRSCWLVPRLGTISPWSSKTTDLLGHCGFDQCVKRIERGVVAMFALQDGTSWQSTWLEACGQALSDPMTETVLLDWADVQHLFDQASPAPMHTIPMLEKGIAVLTTYNEKYGLALSGQEIQLCYRHFKELKRNPSDVEIMMFAQINSEHCRHKIFNASWIINDKAMMQSLFDQVRDTYRQHTKGVECAYSDNAAILTGSQFAYFDSNPLTHHYHYQDQQLHWVIKVETHNHPTAVSPWPGAATGIGGEIRDEGATGRGAVSRAGLIGFSVSDLCLESLPLPWEWKGSKPEHLASAQNIMLHAPLGASSFANEFGRPTIHGYFRTYSAKINGSLYGYHKPIVIAGGMGQIRASQAKKKDLPLGTKLVVLGGSAMRIGLGGGAISSGAVCSGKEDLDFASVQRSNPEMQRRCQQVIEACCALQPNPILSIHDVGAGGLANAIPEIVYDAKRGVNVQLRAILNAEPSMSPLELWCNEAQERYILAIDTVQWATFIELAVRENCPYAMVGRITELQQLLLEDTAHQYDQPPVDLSLSFLLEQKIQQIRKATIIARDTKQLRTSYTFELHEAIQRVLQLPAVGDKSFLITIADRSVGGLVVRDQMVGPWQVPVSDVGVIADSYQGYTGKAMAMGERSPLAVWSAKTAACMAVGEAITNLLAAPVMALSDIKLSANWMASAGDSVREGELYEAVQAVTQELCLPLQLTIPVGKDSLSMRACWQADGVSNEMIAPLSLVVSAFAPLKDVRQVLTPELVPDTVAGKTCLLLIDLASSAETEQRGLAGSALAQVFSLPIDQVPVFPEPARLKGFFDAITALKQEKRVLSYHDRSDGGLWVSLCEMSFASHLGLNITLESLGSDIIQSLFYEGLGVVIQVLKEDQQAVIDCFSMYGLRHCVHEVATLRDDDRLVVHHKEQTLFNEKRVKLQQKWSSTSHQMCFLRDNPSCVQQVQARLTSNQEHQLSAQLSFPLDDTLSAPFTICHKKPKVAILRAQGVNGHREMAAAFTHAGFESVDVAIHDLIEGKQQLRNFECLAVCGGFSYGDVLGAGRGWASVIRYHPRLNDQFITFFERKNSLSLGVCNGAQMLSALRDLIPGAAHFPDFLDNQSQRFEARLVNVRIEAGNSVWLRDMGNSHLPIIVSHMEGRISRCNIPDRPIVLRYSDVNGERSEYYPDNPNGSQQGIAGLCSEDGRILIMMPHPERLVRNVQFSWCPPAWRSYEDSPWFRLFINARRYFDI